MHAIIGATGRVGGSIADLLLKQNRPVRVVIRDAGKSEEWLGKGAEVAIANLFDPDALTEAFKGASAVFVMLPFLSKSIDPISDHHEMLGAVCSAIKMAGPEKLMYLSSIGAHHAAGTGAIYQSYNMEKAFFKLDLPTTGIRPAWFMENFIARLGEVRNSGVLNDFLKPVNEKMPMVSIADVGKLASQLLQTSWSGHRIVDVEGPCRYSINDVAAFVSHLLDRNIIATAIDDTDFIQTYRALGYSPLASYLMAETMRGFNSKHIEFEQTDQGRLKGSVTLQDALNFCCGEIIQA